MTVGYCFIANTCDNYYSKIGTFTITLDKTEYTIPAENLLYDDYGNCYFNMFYNDALDGEIWIG